MLELNANFPEPKCCNKIEAFHAFAIQYRQLEPMVELLIRSFHSLRAHRYLEHPQYSKYCSNPQESFLEPAEHQKRGILFFAHFFKMTKKIFSHIFIHSLKLSQYYSHSFFYPRYFIIDFGLSLWKTISLH